MYAIPVCDRRGHCRGSRRSGDRTLGASVSAVRSVDEKVLREYAGVYRWNPNTYLSPSTNAASADRRVTGTPASFDDLAGDVVAAFAYLKTRSDIDRNRIGLMGVSQAGWIMPLAAVRGTGPAFLISISGEGIPAAETTIDQAQYCVELGPGSPRWRQFTVRL